MDGQVVGQAEVDRINADLATLSHQIYGPALCLAYMHVDALHEQDMNARSMTQQTMAQLTVNIQDAGVMESVPLCVQVGEEIQIISGHHRVRAARAAGLTYIVVLLYRELDQSRVKAKQLAHNSITGTDNPELIRRIWEDIRDVQARFEAYIDPRLFDDIPKAVSFKPVDVDLHKNTKRYLLLFLSTQAEDFDAAIEQLTRGCQPDAIYLAHMDAFDAWQAAFAKTQEKLDIKSVPTAVAEMARIVLGVLAEQEPMEGTNGNGGTEAAGQEADRLAA